MLIDIIIPIITIFGWSFFSFWSAIPAGIALNVAPLFVLLITTASYSAGVGLALLVGAPLRNRIKKRMRQADSDDDTKTAEPTRMVMWINQAWERYGLVGLALLSPMTVGSQMGAVIGLGFGANPVSLWLAMTIGAGVWATVIVLAIQMGLMTITQQPL